MGKAAVHLYTVGKPQAWNNIKKLTVKYGTQSTDFFDEGTGFIWNVFDVSSN